MSSRGPRWRSSRPLAEPAAGWIAGCEVRCHRGGALLTAWVPMPPKRPGFPRVWVSAPPRWCGFPRCGCCRHRGDDPPHKWCSSWAGEPVLTLPLSTAHSLRRTGRCGHCDDGALPAPANRCNHGDAIWSTGPAFLRGVARGPVSPKASRTSSERTRSRRSSVIRLTCAPVSRPSRVSPFRPSDRSS